VTITLRLTGDEEKTLDRVARAHGASRSEALRAALIAEAARLERVETMSAHDRLKRYIPAKGGAGKGKRPSALDSRRRFIEYLEETHRAIRPR
jgi:hypothetical protein